MMEKIEKILDESIRPQLLLHGGGIKSVGLEDGVYRFQLVGQCANCPSAYLETREMIRETLLQALPEIRDVELVRHISEDLLAQARAILNHQPLEDSHHG